MRTSASSSSASSGTTTGRRPTSSGISPKRSRSSGSTSAKGFFLLSSGACRSRSSLAEADLLPAGARLDDLLQPVERAAADEQDVLGVDLDVFLLRVLAAALRRHRGDRALEDLEQRLLHALARDVARDARVLGLARDLVDLVDVDDAALALGDVEVAGLQQPHQDVLHVLADVAGFGERGGVGDGEGHVEDAGQRLGEQRLADAGRADEQDVGLVELDVVVPRRCEALMRL